MTQTFEVSSPEKVIADFRQLIQSKHSRVKGLSEGRWRWVQIRMKGNEDALDAGKWVCLAHLGTLEKLARLFPGDGPYSEFEVVGATRNLFENLVWIKLFERDVQYGLVFYLQLLLDQQKSVQAHIARAEQELELFGAYDKQEADEIAALSAALNRGEISKEEFGPRFQAIAIRMDQIVRDAFAAYGPAAKYNGFGYQCELMRTKVLPGLRSDLLEIEQKIAAFHQTKSQALTPEMIRIADERVNWFTLADRVGLGAEYRFVYSFASKMLHSTPLSTTPNGELSRSEATTLLEYSYVATSRILGCIEGVPIPGVPDMMLIRVDE
ncbi:MAG: hypothetical protein R3C46_03450 [Hyphomonadaceae bacterium]